ncbi:MAG: zf-HC2 domain-containing protein [Gemmatimonadota bacterium]
MNDVHLTDAEVIALLDGEAPGRSGTTVEAHLTRCASCHRSFEELQTTSRRLGALMELGAPSVAPPRYDPAFLDRIEVGARRTARRRRPRPAWLVGAVAATLAAVVVSITPAGAWLVDRIRSFLGPEAPPRVESLTPISAPGTELAFRPVPGGVLTIEVDAGSPPDAVVVGGSTGDLVTARLRGTGQDRELVTTPDGLRARGEPGDTLMVEVPEGVGVEVSAGERVLGRRGAGEVGSEPWVVSTGNPGG